MVVFVRIDKIITRFSGVYENNRGRESKIMTFSE